MLFGTNLPGEAVAEQLEPKLEAGEGLPMEMETEGQVERVEKPTKGAEAGAGLVLPEAPLTAKKMQREVEGEEPEPMGPMGPIEVEVGEEAEEALEPKSKMTAPTTKAEVEAEEGQQVTMLERQMPQEEQGEQAAVAVEQASSNLELEGPRI